MIRAIGKAMVVATLAACASPPPPVRVTTIRDAAWVAALAQRPDADPDRQCVQNSLQVAFALIAFKDGGYDDKSIQRALLETGADKRARAPREAALSDWQRTREPSSAAATHLNACLAENGNALEASEVWLRCFLSTEPAALLSIYRRTGSTLAVAVQAVAPYYPIDVNPSLIAELGGLVFGLQTDADDLRLREDLFVDCVAVAAE